MGIKQKNFAAQIILNVTAWAIFFMLPFVFLPFSPRTSPLQSARFVSLLISSNIILITFYYLNRLLFIPRLLARKKAFLYILTIVLYLLVYMTILYVIFKSAEETRQYLQQFVKDPVLFKQKSTRFWMSFWAGPLALFMLAFLMSSSSKIISQWFLAEETRAEIVKQQLQTELSLLKSQVNPHFLFNTLNSIYSLAVTNSDKTPDAVMKLSRIMRYTLEESQNDEVSLDDELEFIRSYIDLQKMRLTDMVSIKFTVEGATDGVIIAPLLFIPFIENAFKYGISTHHPSAILIHIQVVNGHVIFTCVNDLVPAAHKHESTGTGIINTRRRLELLYPMKHILTIEPGASQYKVLLTINL